MLTLYLIRHAKSDWAKENIPDIDRPLNERGYRDAHFMSKLLKEQKVLPDLIVSSVATRAISTAMIFSRNLNYDPDKLFLSKSLYGSTAKEYLSVVSKMDDQYKSVLLFAHNPTITNFANSITTVFTDHMPTCTIIGIRFKTSEWKNITEAEADLFMFDFPKKHEQG